MGTIARGSKAGGGTNFNTGQVISHTELNTDFNTILTEINGELDDANIKTAELPGSKSLRFTEITAPSSPSANDILLYAKEQSGTRLETKDSAGATRIWGTGVQIIRKTAETQVVNNSTTLVNDDALLAALAASETIRFAAFVVHNSTTSTPNIKFAWTVPSGATLGWAFPNACVSISSTLKEAFFQTTSGAIINVDTNTGSFSQFMTGFVVNSTTAGNFQLQWAQNTATAEDTKLLTNSWLAVWRA